MTKSPLKILLQDKEFQDHLEKGEDALMNFLIPKRYFKNSDYGRFLAGILGIPNKPDFGFTNKEDNMNDMYVEINSIEVQSEFRDKKKKVSRKEQLENILKYKIRPYCVRIIENNVIVEYDLSGKLFEKKLHVYSEPVKYFKKW